MANSIHSALQPGTGLQGKAFRYTIIQVIDQNPFCTTYLAKMNSGDAGNSPGYEIKVVIKEFFLSELNMRKKDGTTVDGTSEKVFMDYQKRFRTLADQLYPLDNPGIVKVYDVFEANDTTYLVTENIEGESLENHIAKQGHLTEQETLAISKVLSALVKYLHANGLAHLDIQPKNIIRRYDGQYTLTDFGLLRQYDDAGNSEYLTTIGLGTPGYSAPEYAEKRAEGNPAALDIYALGATMYTMLTGECPPEAAVIAYYGFPKEKLEEAGTSSQTIKHIEERMHPESKNRPLLVEQVKKPAAPAYQEPAPVYTPTPEPSYSQPEEYSYTEYEEPDYSTYQEPNYYSPRQFLYTNNQTPRHPSNSESNTNTDFLTKAIGIIFMIGIGIIVYFIQFNDDDDYSYYDEYPKTEYSEYEGEEEGHEWVDLGLPSGLLWATCNIGAEYPYEYGDYFAWGETDTKEIYLDKEGLTYLKDDVWLLKNEYIDSCANLMPGHDVAREKWGGRWRMPTKEEFEELLKYTYQSHDVGCSLTSTENDKEIYLPAAGYFGSELTDDEVEGYYLSSTIENDARSMVYILNFNANNISMSTDKRRVGMSVRPVFDPNE